MESDRSYFIRRAAQERSAADIAGDDAARTVHLELEQRYRKLVSFPRSKTTSRLRPEI